MKNASPPPSTNLWQRATLTYAALWLVGLLVWTRLAGSPWAFKTAGALLLPALFFRRGWTVANSPAGNFSLPLVHRDVAHLRRLWPTIPLDQRGTWSRRPQQHNPPSSRPGACSASAWAGRFGIWNAAPAGSKCSDWKSTLPKGTSFTQPRTKTRSRRRPASDRGTGFDPYAWYYGRKNRKLKQSTLLTIAYSAAFWVAWPTLLYLLQFQGCASQEKFEIPGGGGQYKQIAQKSVKIQKVIRKRYVINPFRRDQVRRAADRQSAAESR
jgi:hypothetical protein